MMARLAWLLGLFLVNPSFAQNFDEARLQAISSSAHWHKLLHYKDKPFRQARSLVDGPGFFFAPDGAHNALSELKASIAAMQSPDLQVGRYKLQPQCAFPARYQFLKQQLGTFTKEHDCPKVKEFLETFKGAQSVSVVFSSAYPNNPASMFGHSFLKLNTKRGTELTDMGINFAAQVADDENPFAFIYFGTTGGYLGQWTIQAYHDKIKEYVQGENRDLWEYELNLSPEETRLFLYHLWELETNSYFAYYFFDENCSYQILAALEAVRPEWELTDHTIYLIPGESIKNLFLRDDVVRLVSFRPSVQKKVLQQYRALNSKEREQFFLLIKQQDAPTDASIALLEAGISYYDFLRIKKKGNLSPAEQTQSLKLLSQRASAGVASAEVQARLRPIKGETRPDLGHDSYVVSLAQVLRKRADNFGMGGTTNLKLKSAYHDLMNNDLGYSRYSHIDFPGISVQYDYDLKTFSIDELIGLNITSLPPMNFLSWAPAWKVASGLYTAKDYGCLSCRHIFAELGIGAATSLVTQDHLLYALVTARGELYHRLRDGYRYGPGLESGIFIQVHEKSKVNLSYKQFFYIDTPTAAKRVGHYLLQNSYYLNRNHELRLGFNMIYPHGDSINRQQEFKFEFLNFF